MNNQKEIEERLKVQQKIQELENLAKQYMTYEAIIRYGTLKSVHFEKALQSIALIARLGSQNQIREKITDQQFKDLLLKLEPEKRQTKVTWK